MSISLIARTAALAVSLALPLLAWGPAPAAADNPCNPCAMKSGNPCAARSMNPCAAKKANPCAVKHMNPCNPCGAKGMNPCNPCGAKGMNPCNPCGAKGMNPCNPCGAKGMNPCNPCGASGSIDPAKFTRPAGVRVGGDKARLLVEGEKLWNDNSLSENGAACSTCHMNNAGFLPSFAKPYPHEVAMVKNMTGKARVDAAEMVQFCMIQPMQADPLPWGSARLAALTAYVEHLQQGFQPNPCAMKSPNPCNPCAMKSGNPCAMKSGNPCAMKNAGNPCAMKSANPCAMKNPCRAMKNPCRR